MTSRAFTNYSSTSKRQSDSGYASSQQQRRTRSLPQRRPTRARTTVADADYAELPEPDPNKPTVIRHKKVDEPIAHKWIGTLRGEFYNENKPDFVLDTTNGADGSKSKRDRASRISYKEEFMRKQQKREEEKANLESWQGSLRGGLDDQPWVTDTRTVATKQARAGSEKRYKGGSLGR